MTLDEKYMMRCLQLANKGLGTTRPNPMVGAVIVDNGEIIGEGYHRVYGEAHAEVNAINSVKDKSRLSTATMYVSLEPCAHYGKTPPCAELIVKSGISKVFVGASDPNPSVSGKGVEVMRNAGVEVIVGVLENKAKEQNRMFRINQILKRPYIILKWAQSADGFIDYIRNVGDGKESAKFSNELSSVFVHNLRTQVQSIMVGTNTALLDNPKLTARNWYGENPTRITIDRSGELPYDCALFGEEADTIVFTEVEYPHSSSRLKSIILDFNGDINEQILKCLYDNEIYSVLIEGGTKLLSSFIDKGMWDEMYVEVSRKVLNEGVRSPKINFEATTIRCFGNTIQHHLKNKITQNII